MLKKDTMTFSIFSVLGDTRDALVHPGDGYPWVTCPFCGSPVYIGEPAPVHARVAVSRAGRCDNPWCPANPAMPLDAARVARGEAILAEMAEQERQRNHASAMHRLAEDCVAKSAAWTALLAEGKRRGSCMDCLRASTLDRPRLVRHRGHCPR